MIDSARRVIQQAAKRPGTGQPAVVADGTRWHNPEGWQLVPARFGFNHKEWNSA
jgi:hypothetical protein